MHKQGEDSVGSVGHDRTGSVYLVKTGRPVNQERVELEQEALERFKEEQREHQDEDDYQVIKDKWLEKDISLKFRNSIPLSTQEMDLQLLRDRYHKNPFLYHYIKIYLTLRLRGQDVHLVYLKDNLVFPQVFVLLLLKIPVSLL